MNYIVENFPVIATTFLTTAIGAYFLWRNNFKSRRVAACSDFRSNFAVALTELDVRQNIAQTVIFGSARHDTAIIEFRPYVVIFDRRSFDRAVTKYKECRRNVSNPDEERDGCDSN